MLCGDQVRSKQLVPILPDWAGVSGGLYALFPSRKLLAAPVRIFLNLLDKFKDKNLTKVDNQNQKNKNIVHYLENMRLSPPNIEYHFAMEIDSPANK